MLNYNLEEALFLARKEAEVLSIGERQEHTMHRVIKYLIDPSSNFHEKKINNKIVDICIDNEIYEVQTRSFNNLRNKLESLLPNYHVTIIYPCIVNKKIIKINEFDEVIEKRKSPKKGLPIYSLIELYKIKFFLKDPNLKIKLLLFDVEEIQQQVNKSYKYRHGKVRIDQVPKKILDEIDINNILDYKKLLPTIENEFTQKEFNKIIKCSDKQGSYILNVLKYLGLVYQTGMRNRAYLYKIKNC